MNKIEDKSTPEPWAYGVENNGRPIVYHKLTDISYEVVCFVNKQEGLRVLTDEEVCANGILIAAAPEMRDFIANFLEEMDKYSGVTPEQSKLIARAEYLLKKAYNF